MKSILLSIKPKWCELISSNKKPLEIRKTKPMLETPFKCYIYETKGKTAVPTFIDGEGHEIYQGRGQVIGEFMCDKIANLVAEFTTDDCYEDIRSFYYDEDVEEYEEELITSNEYPNPSDCWLCKQSCLSFDEIKNYVFNGTSGFFNLYGWHISELKIYDKPKELINFTGLRKTKFGYEPVKVIRPPQSWCYVQELEVENV